MKSLLKYVLAVILIIIVPSPFADAGAEGAPLSVDAVATASPEVTETPAVELPQETAIPALEEDALPAETSAPEATPLPTETIAPEASGAPSETEVLMSLLAPDRSARISASWEAEHLGVGDEVTLSAVLSGYDAVAYDLVWQSSVDGEEWVDRAQGGARFSYTLDTDNYAWMWRVVVVIHGPAQQ